MNARHGAALALSLIGCIVGCIVSSNPPPAGPYGPPPGGTQGPPAPPPDNRATQGQGIAYGGTSYGGSSYGGTAGTVSNGASSAVVLACEQRANNVKGNTNTSWYMRCPPCAAAGAPVWGTDLYTDDSGVCAAAIHAGRLGPQGGLVLVTWLAGQPTYIGSARNGIRSADYGPWRRSFFVQSVDAQGRPTSPPVAPLPPGTVRMSCAMAGTTVKSTVRVLCPPGCRSGRLWGTDVYTGDSSPCVAAVHAGLATFEAGGSVVMTPGGPQPGFTGSRRNGVTSASYGRYGSSFTLSR
jgi:LCCL domain